MKMLTDHAQTPRSVVTMTPMMTGSASSMSLRTFETFSSSDASIMADKVRIALTVEDRALYLALHRLEERGLVESDWGLSENNRRARFYQLTRAGKRELASRKNHWSLYAEAVFKVLRAA